MNWTRHATIKDNAARGGDHGATHYSWETRYTDPKAGAVYNAAWYTIDAGHGQYRVEAEYMSCLCRNVSDPGGPGSTSDEEWGHYPTLYASIDAADQAAERLARQHSERDINWLL